MYRRPRFLELLLEIRQAMSREADYDIDLFAEMIRSGNFKDVLTVENAASESEFGEAAE